MFVEENLDRKKKKIVKNVKIPYKQSHKLHAVGEYHTSFQGTNGQHIGSLTKKWKEMTSPLENTEILFEPHTDVQTS